MVESRLPPSPSPLQFLKSLLEQGRLAESRQLAKEAKVHIDFDAVMRSRWGGAGAMQIWGGGSREDWGGGALNHELGQVREREPCRIWGGGRGPRCPNCFVAGKGGADVLVSGHAPAPKHPV